jgi:hypothetical protein
MYGGYKMDIPVNGIIKEMGKFIPNDLNDRMAKRMKDGVKGIDLRS